LVEISIGFLPSEPDVAANGLTHIEDCALNLIWKREFGVGREIPSDIMSYWTEGSRRKNNLVKRLMEEDAWCVPSDRGTQCGLLELLTGSRMGFTPKAKSVSKDAYTLINAIHSYRNRSEHGDGQEMSLGVAVAAIMTCIELLACLERDFSK
jgi:hypothetical protein